MDIVIHLGLHRTGSTALQGALARARDRLAPHGVGYPGMPATRPVVAHALGAAEWRGPRGMAARIVARRRLRAWARAREAEGVSRLILSDETLAGDLDPCLTGAGPYPHAAARLALLAEAFAPWTCRAAAALRDPADWLASARAFALSRRPQPDFAPARAAALDPAARGWADLAAEIHAAFPDPVFWDAGVYETNPRRIHKLLAGPGVAREVRGARRQAQEARVNPGLPPAALAALEAAHAAGETVDAARREALVAAATARAGTPARWDPWTAAERETLAARYRADLAAIRAMGLTVLGGEPAAGPGAGKRRPAGPGAGKRRPAGPGAGNRAGPGGRKGRGKAGGGGRKAVRATAAAAAKAADEHHHHMRRAPGRDGPAAPPVIGTIALRARQGGPT